MGSLLDGSAVSSDKPVEARIPDSSIEKVVARIPRRAMSLAVDFLDIAVRLLIIRSQQPFKVECNEQDISFS